MTKSFNVHSIKSKLAIGKEARKLSVEDLEVFITFLTQELTAAQKRQDDLNDRRRRKDIDKILRMMGKVGVTADDLKASGKRRTQKTRKPTKRVAPKYQIVVEGIEYRWTGRGRTPKVFQEYFDAGNSKESCRINPPQ